MVLYKKTSRLHTTCKKGGDSIDALYPCQVIALFSVTIRQSSLLGHWCQERRSHRRNSHVRPVVRLPGAKGFTSGDHAREVFGLLLSPSYACLAARVGDTFSIFREAENGEVCQVEICT